MNVHFILHESFEAPAAIEAWAKRKMHMIAYTRTYQGEKLPENAEKIDLLIVMGGPQSPATSQTECPHFDAAGEIGLIQKTIQSGKPVLGVCLGAQLIGEALGARFEHSPNREIGVLELELTEDAKQDPIFSKFPGTFKVGHWHGDMPGLTAESKVLAKSQGCPRQIVKYGPKVYGFQCHFEFTPESIEGMIQNAQEELESSQELPFVRTKEELRKADYGKMNQLLFDFLDYIESLE